jgi:protein-S-isoprenylcysteine O-methyltransferase Ste14
MTVLPTALRISLVCWFAFEVGLDVRDIVRRKGRLRRDRGTRLVVSLSLGVAVLMAILTRQWVPSLDAPAHEVFLVVGVIVVWIGLAVRAWAVITLGASFRTYVAVDADQTVVTRGPYRWVRHPSYTGLLLILLGFGLGIGNWLSLAICAVVPGLGLLPRIVVEEAEMTRVLGDPYREYRARTRRLIPGLW